MFADMGFLRFIVTDASTSHIVSQRIVPFSSLRPGYRHLRLRSPSNQPLELATLFIYSKTEEDLLEGRSSIDISQTAAVTGKRMSLFTKVKELSEASKEIKEVSTRVRTDQRGQYVSQDRSGRSGQVRDVSTGARTHIRVVKC